MFYFNGGFKKILWNWINFKGWCFRSGNFLEILVGGSLWGFVGFIKRNENGILFRYFNILECECNLLFNPQKFSG